MGPMPVNQVSHTALPNACLKIRDITVDSALKEEERRKLRGLFNLFTPVPEDGSTRSFRNVGLYLKKFRVSRPRIGGNFYGYNVCW